MVVFVVSFIPALLYLKLMPRTYEFAASILLQDDKESPMSSIGIGGATGLMKSFGIGAGEGSVNVEDEMEILTSKRMFRMMILDLGINVDYTAPYSFYKMYQEAPLRLAVDSSTMANLQDEYRFAVSVSPGQVKVKVKTWLGGLKQTHTFSSLPAVIKIDREAFVLDFDHDGAQKKAFKLNIKVVPAGWMAETQGKDIEVEDVSNVSNVLMLTCSDHSRQRGLDRLNTLIDAYNKDMESYKRQEVDRKKSFVERRISEILIELDVVEANIKDFKAKNEMTLLESDVLLYSELFKDIRVALTQTEIQAHQIDLLDDYLKDPENRNKAIPSVFSVEEGEKGIVSQYNKAVVSREKVLISSNASNYMYRQLNSDVEILRDAVQVMIGNARKSIEKALDDLKKQEKELMAKFKSVPEKEHEYVGYVRDQEILQGLYLLMLQQREETINTLGKLHERARVIEPPYIKKKPLGPRKLYAGIGILVLTLVVPLGYLITKDILISIKDEFKK